MLAKANRQFAGSATSSATRTTTDWRRQPAAANVDSVHKDVNDVHAILMATDQRIWTDSLIARWRRSRSLRV
jgi:hypothetical protein